MLTKESARERAEQIAGEGNGYWATHEWADVLTALILAVQNETVAECVRSLPGGAHCDPQEIADMFRVLIKED